MEYNIQIKKIIVHILDVNIQTPVLSDGELYLEEELKDFFVKHITKILEDDNIKKAFLNNNDNKVQLLCRQLHAQPEAFISATMELANILFDIMQKNVDIPSADVVFCLLDIDGIPSLGILKLNYKHSFIHYVQNSDTGRFNTIIKQKTTLPSETQRVEECAIISFQDFGVKLLEKKYEVNGEKLYYLSSMFLECNSQSSVSEKVKLFKKVTEVFSKKYFDADMTKPVEIKKAIAESIERNDNIDIADVADNIFKQNLDLKREYMEVIEQVGFREKVVPVSEKIVERSFKRQKIKTDSGIEISLPVEFYGNSEKIEFINNPDGTISIVIKNVGGISG